MTNQVLDGYLCCLVGANQYALHGADVSVVARAEDMRRQHGQDGRVGTLAVRGRDLPVYSLPQLLGGAADVTVSDRHIVVTGHAEPYGLLVDRIVRAGDSGAHVLALPSVIGGAAAKWFAGLLMLQETSCLVLNPDGLRPWVATTSRRSPVVPAAREKPAEQIRGLVITFTSASLPPVAGVGEYAVSAARVNAVVQSLPLVPLPGCAPHIAGVAAWRQSAVAVLDCGVDAALAPRTRRFLVMRCGDGSLVAASVDAETSLRRATPQDLRAVTETHDGLRGVFRIGGRLVALIDVDRLASGAMASQAAELRGRSAPVMV